MVCFFEISREQKFLNRERPIVTTPKQSPAG